MAAMNSNGLYAAYKAKDTRFDGMLRFLAGRAIPGAEAGRNNEYLRIVCLPNADKQPVYGWIRIAHTPKNNTLTVTLGEALLPVLPQILARVRQL